HTDLLGRVAFHDQASVMSLLHAGDKAFKDVLAKVLELDVWAAAKDLAGARLKAAKQTLTEHEATVAARQDYIDRLMAEVAAAQEREQAWEVSQQERLQHAKKEAVKAAGSAADAGNGCREAAVNLEQLAAALRSQDTTDRIPFSDSADQDDADGLDESNQLEEMTDSAMAEELGALLHAIEEKLRGLESKSVKLQVAAASTATALAAAEAHLQGYVDKGKGGAVCTECLQPVAEEHYAAQMERLERETHLIREQHEVRERSVELQQQRVREAQERRTAVRARLDAAGERQAAKQAMLREALSRQRERARRQAQRLQEQQAATAAQERRLGEAGWLVEKGIQTGEQIHALGEESLHDLGAVESTQPPAATQLATSSGCGEVSWNALGEAMEQTTTALELAEASASRLAEREAALGRMSKEGNPHCDERLRLEAMVRAEEDRVESSSVLADAARGEVEQLLEVDKAFARTGIQSYLVDEALSEVQRRASAHLEVLAGGSLTLELSATRKAKSRAGAAPSFP
ncbi:hypothetical protein CYMTET_24462, partial [Cymbomonas tetramitiformis]